MGVKVDDATAYTFKSGGNGLYSAAENWTMNKTTGCGAPISAGATIAFPGGKTSDLKVDGAYAFDTWNWSGADHD